MSLTSSIRESLRTHRGRIALSSFVPPGPATAVTYRALDEGVREIEAALCAQGCHPGDLVLCYMSKCPSQVAALLATILAGGVGCCLNSRLKPPQVLRMARSAGARHLLLDKGSLRDVTRHLRGVEDALDSGSSVARAREVQLPTLGARTPLYLLHLPAMPGGAPPSAGGDPGTAGAAACLFTSGSTGSQKGVLIAGGDLLERASVEAGYFGLREGDALLSLLPLSFDVGLNQLLSCLLTGGNLVILNSWFPNDVRAAVSACGVAGVSGVPYLWVEMMSAYPEGFLPAGAGALRYVTVSGGDLSQPQLGRLRIHCAGVDIFKTYGQTETFRSGILEPRDFQRKMTSVGKPVSGTRVTIVDAEGRAVPPDVEGEIVHEGTGTMLGYLNDPEGTRRKVRRPAAARTGVAAEGSAVYTGDRGRLDHDGYIYVHGREDGMIKVSGQRVYPKEIEDCILRHPRVRRAAVVGISDERKGQSIAAEIVVDGAVPPESVLSHLRSELASYMVPDTLRIVNELPVSENGKVLYAVIRERYEKVRVL